MGQSADNEIEGSNHIRTSTNATHSQRRVINPTWTHLTEGLLHKWIRQGVVKLAVTSAKYPLTTILSITTLSFALIIIGFFTNFTVIYSHEEIFTPFGSLAEQHHQWLVQESGFALTRPFFILLHRNGESMLQASSLQMLFTALTTLQSTPGYDEACAQSQYLSKATNQPTCRLSSATQFWNHDIQQLLQETSQLKTVQEQDQYITQIMSSAYFPDETPVFHEAILGNYQMGQNTTTFSLTLKGASTNTTSPRQRLTMAQSYIIKVDIPNLQKDSDELEKRILARLKDVRDDWASDQTSNSEGVELEYFTMYAYMLEFERAVYSDIVLVVLMMMIMVAFCCAVFYQRKDKIQSRALVGFFSIATIGMSLFTGYGLVWIMGVPFTNIAMMVPFIIVGVGLDDTFIITGAYFRKSAAAAAQQSNKNSNNDNTIAALFAKDAVRDDPIIARVEETMEEVANSISMTTITTIVAFALGAICSIPAVQWLCIYGLTCIGVDFIYQNSYFIAWMVLDERRVHARRKDICFWTIMPEEEEGGEEEEGDERDAQGHDHEQKNATSTEPNVTSVPLSTHAKNAQERFMGWYADKLLHPASKAFVLVLFATYTAGCIYSTTLLTQQFNVENYVPKDSHVQTFFVNFEQYSSLFRAIQVYFRNEDQSDPAVQQQMITYVEELSQMDQIGAPPMFFWLRDFAEMANSPEFEQQAMALGLQNATFEEQIDTVLSIPEVRDVYGEDVVRDSDTGVITASRCYLYLRKIDMHSIPNQISLLLDQREITESQPINKGKDEASFFTFDDLYFFFELYAVTVQQLIITTISGVVSVSAVAFLLVPHWSALVFVLPLIIALYFMLLGTMQYSGIHINAVSYVIIVIAIGLLVDFLMHVLLRYFESRGKTRHEKVKDTLETMGASILLGGATTFVGVIPLAFSTTTVFMVVFKSFLAMVCLGCGVGLILLPVLLSLVGPLVTIHDEVKDGATVDDGASRLGSKDSLLGCDQGETREVDSSSEEELDGRSTDERDSRTRLVITTPRGSVECSSEFEA